MESMRSKTFGAALGLREARRRSLGTAINPVGVAFRAVSFAAQRSIALPARFRHLRYGYLQSFLHLSPNQESCFPRPDPGPIGIFNERSSLDSYLRAADSSGQN